MRALLPVTLAVLWLAGCGDSSAVKGCEDDDRDGYGNGLTCISLDCNDDDANIHPGAADTIGDGIDSDCNNTELCYADADDDGVRGLGTVLSPNASCDEDGEAGSSDSTGDCDDTSELAFPGASEIVGDGMDQSCDGREVCFRDGEGDGRRSTSSIMSNDADCADMNEALATAPIDCDDTTADNTPYTFYLDADHDGHGSTTTTIACTQPAGYAATADDCDDTDGTAWTTQSRYPDADGDGYGTGATQAVCEGATPPLGFAAVMGDCSTNDPTAYPGAPELPDDGVDQDCASGDLVMSDSAGVFVRQGASDANPGTRASPVGTLARAFEIATGSKVIFIANGTYAFDVEATGFSRSIFGGYANDFNSRISGEGTVIQANGALGVASGTIAIERVRLVVTNDGTVMSAAVFAIDTKLTLRDVWIDRGVAVMASGVLASGSTVVADRLRISLEDASECTGVYVAGGRLLLLRSRIDTCAPLAGDAVGVHVSIESLDDVTLAAIIGNVIDVGHSGSGESTGVRLAGTGSHVIVAHNAVHLEGKAGVSSPMRGVDITDTSVGFTRASLLSNIVSTNAVGSDTAALGMPGGTYASASIVANDFFTSGAGQCAVKEADVCVVTAMVTNCGFTGCVTSTSNLFVDPGYADAAGHIVAASMCVDAGVAPSVLEALFARDMDGDMRPQGAGLDIGADERVP